MLRGTFFYGLPGPVEPSAPNRSHTFRPGCAAAQHIL